MFSFFYDFVLFFIGLIALPKLVWQWMRHGKYRHSLAARLGLSLPNWTKTNRMVIWIHAVSVGETRAVIALYQNLKHAHPDADFLISSTTETGHAEARRSLPGAAGYFFLPLDFSWVIKRITKKIRPTLLILVESDFWYNLLNYCKKESAQILLVNGKISERSFKRFRSFRFFSKRLFPLIDHLCVQNSIYQHYFLQLGIPAEKIQVTGNLKLHTPTAKLTSLQQKLWKDELGIQHDDRVVIIGSTHEPEEEWLLSALDEVCKTCPQLKILLVPRHPERFEHVEKKLQERGLEVLTFSKRHEKKGQERVVLIDAMGFLLTCYQLGELAIVGGSFVSHVGGHNIFEPLLFGLPVIFGPYMHKQKELTSFVLEKKAGFQVSLNEVGAAVTLLLNNPAKKEHLSLAASQMAEEGQNSLEKTWKIIEVSLAEKLKKSES